MDRLDQGQSENLTKKLTSIKCGTPIALILTILSTIFAFIYYSDNSNFEFLILGITDILLIIVYAMVFYFIFTIQADLHTDGIFQSNNTSYFVQLGLQSLSAISFGILITMIQYKQHLQQFWFTALQIAKIILLMYITNKCKKFNKNNNGIYRFILTATGIISIIFLFFAAMNFKFIAYLINNQVFQFDDNNSIMIFMQYGLLALLTAILLLCVILLFRVQNYFLIVAFIICGTLFIAATANGIMIRQHSYISNQLTTDQGCRYALQSLGMQTVKENLSCQQKYLKEDQSPYLECPQDQQSYMWEQNMDQLACINLGCCNSMKEYLVKPIYHLTVWINIIVALGIIQAINTALLSTFETGNKMQNVINDIIMFCVFIGVLISIIAIYNSISPTELQLQDQIVEKPLILNQLTVLQPPSYKKFKSQKPLGSESSDLQICELATNLILTKIDLEPPKELKKPGITLAILGSGGSFLINNEFNLKDFKILTTDELAQKVFPKAAKPDYDAIIVQGSISSISHFMGTSLQYCSDEPESADFNVVQQFYDLETKTNRLLEINPMLQKQISKYVTYLNIVANVQNVEDFTPISGVDGKLYNGKFVYTTCQVMDQIESPFLSSVSDQDGLLNFFSVSSKQVYTLLVKKEGYKNACALVDLTELSPKLNIYVRMVKNDNNKHSMKVALEWTSKNLNLDLYGQFKGEGFTCLTGALSKSCGGMSLQYKNERDQHMEILNIEKIQPFTYLIFIKRFMERSQAEDNTMNAQDWIEANPVITIYVEELEYPLVQYRLPQIPVQFKQKIDITWLVFQFDGSIGDGPIELKTYWSEISNESIKQKKSSKQKFWPSPIPIQRN